MLEQREIPLKGTIRSLDPRGHGIIQAADGSRVAFLFTDVLSRKELVLGQYVNFSVRRVQDKVFAENISHVTERPVDAQTD
jgi:cold shock CspA family protein